LYKEKRGDIFNTPSGKKIMANTSCPSGQLTGYVAWEAGRIPFLPGASGEFLGPGLEG